MRKIVTNILLLIIGVLLIVFFVANRQDVKISMDPFSLEDPAFYLELPMWAAFALTLFIGFGLGALGMWASSGNLRRRARTRKAEVRRLQRELELAATVPPEDSSREIIVRD